MYSVPRLTDYSAAALERASAELFSALGEEASAVKSEADWKIFRDRWMARKNGVLTEINELWLKAAPKDAKREVGLRVNQLKGIIEEEVAKAEDIQLHLSNATSSKGSADSLDITLPGN